MADVILTDPSALLLLVLVPVMVAAARARRLPRGAILLRMLVMGALIGSLAAPTISSLGGGQSVIFALDFSDSIAAPARDAAVAFVRQAARTRSSGDRIGVVTFGATAVLEEAPGHDPVLALTTRPGGDATDLAQAIRTALAALPTSGGRRVVLATDGNANRGDLAQALALARSQGVEISVVPLLPGRGGDVLVEEVIAPAEVRAGERFTIRVPVVATARGTATLRVLEDDTVLMERRLAVEPGRTVGTLTRVARRAGLLRYTAAITAVPDSVPENNRAEAQVTVRGAPVVWYVTDGAGPLQAALAAQGVLVRTLSPETVPAALGEFRGVAAVVLDDVSAHRLSSAQMAALRDFVGRLGGGLVVFGGPHSYGVGGYAGTPLEEALPVAMDVRHRLAIPSMAIILALDTSGSMGAFGTQIAKVELAKETAQSVIELLGERDVIGVISFDQEAQWLVAPTEAAQRDRVMDQVSRVQAGGGTNLLPALRLARDYLRQSPAKIRHIVVLSDGQTDPGDYEELVTRMARERITTSSVAIGSDADLEFMRALGRWGAGRSYVTKDLYSIPQILTAEALLASRTYIVEERFAPEVTGRGLVDDLAPPALRGYVATAPKPAGTMHLVSPHDDPILATWQYGVGRAVAFTSDAGSRWAVEWMGWSDLARFWYRLVRWAARDDAEGLQLSVEQVDAAGARAAAGGFAAITVDAFTASGDPVDDLPVEAHVAGPDGSVTAMPLVQSAPGRYEGVVSAAQAGSYAVTVVARDPGGSRLRTTGFVVPYSPELREVTPNRPVLAQIAEATGGRLLQHPRDALAPARTARMPVDAWPPLAAAALGLFLAEIAWRRVPAIGEVLRTAVAGVLARVRRAPSAEAVRADQTYEAADRWQVFEPPSPGSESMEAAARLYIARLKAARAADETAAKEKP